MKKIINTFILLILASGFIIGQNSSDALRFSFLNPQTTARSIGVGGAMGALGGDFSTLATNPAGIGGFWKSEFMVSGSYGNNFTESSLLNQLPSEESANIFNLNNAGIVFTQIPTRGKWKTVSFGVGLNRMADFNQEFFFLGESIGGMVDRFAGLAYNLAPEELDQFEAELAYSTEAIFDVEGDRIYETDLIGQEDQEFNKQQFGDITGYYNEMALSFGGNYNDKVLLGATIGIPFVLYKSEKFYQEFDNADRIPAFNELGFREFLRIDGGGINIKLGAIAKVDEMIRVGLAFHSPTLLTLTDLYATDLNYEYVDGSGTNRFEDSSPEGEFEYSLTTPWRAIGSVAAIFKKVGFLSADVEFVDYASARFDFTTKSDNIEDKEYQNEVNQDIKDRFSPAVNIRLGGELALDNFRLRGGFQLMGSPLTDDDTNQAIYSLGAGVRGNKAYLDLGFSYQTNTEGYLPYLIDDAPQQLVENKIRRSRLTLTVGVKI
jgi:hypothetical protein